MIGSIERLRRHVRARHWAPMMLLVIGVPTRPDPVNKRAVGTAGVVPLPAAPAPATAARADGPAELRRDTRAERGRVLYPSGRAARDTSSGRTLRKQPSPTQRVSQSRSASSAGPNS